MNTLLKENRPLIIGLTGGIGSGKSTISKVFQSFGIKVFNSDFEGKKILNTNNEVKQDIIRLFGSDVYINGELDTKKVSALVFNDKILLDKLNSIVHPRVNNAFNIWVDKNKEDNVLIKESAILVEIGADKDLDDLILVIADKNERIERVIDRDKTTAENVENRINNQLSDSEKEKKCKYVIKNNKGDLIIPQVQNIISQLYSLSSSSSSSSSSSE